MEMGRYANELSEPLLERLALTPWLGQQEIDPPVAGRSVGSKAQQGAL
jgi:hypothetical protein